MTSPSKATATHPERAATSDASEVADQTRRPGHLPVKALMARRARAAAGYESPVQLALKLGVRVWLVKRHESRAFDHAPTLGHMLADRAYGLHLAGEVAREHGAHVQPLPAVVHASHAARLASVTSESTDVLRELTRALADGLIDAAEWERIDRETDEALAALLEIKAARAAARER